MTKGAVDQFVLIMDEQIKLFYDHYNTLEKKLSTHLTQSLKREFGEGEDTLAEILRRIDDLDSLTHQTLDLCHYININVTAIRKILKKFDKKFRMFKNPVALHYLQKLLTKGNTGLVYILQFKVIDQSSAIIDKISDRLLNRLLNIKRGSEYMEAMREPLLLRDINIDTYSGIKSDKIIQTVRNKIERIKESVELIDNANDSIRVGVNDWSLIIRSHIRVVNDNYSKSSADLNKPTRRKSLLLDKLTPQLHEEENLNLDISNKINIWIALFHTFLYTMNCYIVQPTNALYVAELGASRFLSGLIMGMTPLAAIFCTFFYSYWTNYTYKHPLLFSCTAFIIGNVLYSIAYNYNSFFMMGLGRFLEGVGSARVINRRYLIEEVPQQLIMHYSLLYVVATCIGMATGI